MNIETVTPYEIRAMVDDLETVLKDRLYLLHLACGTQDTLECIMWKSGLTVPDEEQLERLILVYGVLMEIVDQRGANQARAWLCQSRCVGGMPVYDAVRVGNYEAFRKAAMRLGVFMPLS